MDRVELTARMASDTPPVLVDVRTGFEFAAGHIAGALHAPTWRILLGLSRLPADRGAELVVMCELGPRASIAKSLLALFGYHRVSLLEGHMAGWRRSGLPVQR